jgi:hypothetical protein
VVVTFTDAKLGLSAPGLEAGTTTFVVVNKGKKVHVLQVKGPGIRAMRTGKVPAGKSARLTVTLRPGAYVLSDPVGLGEYNVMFLQVLKPAVLHAKGDGSVVNPLPAPPPMCSPDFTP